RSRSGRQHRDTVRISASVLRPVYLELVRQEKLTGVYWCQIVGRIVTEHLVGGIVDRELAGVRLASRLGTGDGRNGSKGQERVRFEAKNGYKMATGMSTGQTFFAVST